MAIDDVAGALIPPGISKVLAWRLAVSLSVSILSFFCIWAMGWLPMFGNGFARADKVDQILNELQDQKVVRLETEIRDLQKSYCTAKDERSSDYWVRERDNKIRWYYDLTKRNYPLPSCVELGSTR